MSAHAVYRDVPSRHHCRKHPSCYTTGAAWRTPPPLLATTVLTLTIGAAWSMRERGSDQSLAFASRATSGRQCAK